MLYLKNFTIITGSANPGATIHAWMPRNKELECWATTETEVRKGVTLVGHVLTTKNLARSAQFAGWTCDVVNPKTKKIVKVVMSNKDLYKPKPSRMPPPAPQNSDNHVAKQLSKLKETKLPPKDCDCGDCTVMKDLFYDDIDPDDDSPQAQLLRVNEIVKMFVESGVAAECAQG